MKRIFSALAALLVFMILSCSSRPTKGNTSSGSETTSLTLVETNAPNSDYKPAFEGQTRIAGVKTKAAYQGKILAEGLQSPWGITSLPDGRFLITQKEGTMRIASQDGKLSSAITGLPEVNTKGQGGLLGLTIDPDFTNNRMVYFSFSEKMPDGNLTAVGKGRLSDDEKTIENAQTIYRATPAFPSNLHYGGRLVDPNNHTRNKKFSLATEAMRVYTIPDMMK